MKLDLSKTFLNGQEDVTAALVPPSAGAKWGRRAVLVVILLPVVGYLFLIGSALREKLRPDINPLGDGWFLVTNRDHDFQFELPASPSQHTVNSEKEYHLYSGLQFTVVVRSDSVARHLLNKTASKVLQEATQANSSQGKVSVLGSGVRDVKTHWIEYKIANGGGPDQQVTRTRLMIHNKQLLQLTVTGPEAEIMSKDADRIINSARWINH